MKSLRIALSLALLLAGTAAGNDRHEIGIVHLRRSRVVHDQVEHRLVELAAPVKQQGRDA